MAQHLQPYPSIAVRITTSSLILDLSQQTPFTISLTFTLNHTHPITFAARLATLFDGNLLRAGGLTFTNTATGEPVQRNSRNLHYESLSSNDNDEDATPSEQTKDRFVTLHPGQEHILHATLQPILSNPIFPTQGLTSQEIVAKQEALPKTWKWYNVAGMQDREVYEVGISEGAGIRVWMQGSVEGLVEMRRIGLTPEARRGVVRFVVVEPTRFEMRRPDRDGSLDWP
jgi:hypothetical protein